MFKSMVVRIMSGLTRMETKYPPGELEDMAMKHQISKKAEGLGLLANGSSRRWEICVDESVDHDKWFLEIDGPHYYLVIQLDDLLVVKRFLRFLDQKDGQDELALGRFGSTSVSLLRDNEDFPRFFIVIGPKSQCTLRLSF